MTVTLPVTEKAFQATVIELARWFGWRVHHPHDSRRSEPGWPDLVLARPATREVLFVELKTARGRLTDDQGWWLDALHVAGLETAVWRPADWVAIEARLKRNWPEGR
jgi:hypothetical protein